MSHAVETREPLRILIAALGGEGGGTLMNWVVSAARAAGLSAQATSVPGVAQRTGSTSYYIEVAKDPADAGAILGLVPMPGRVDVVVSSELVETARVLTAGYISPDRTTVVSSTARTFSTAEKMQMGDGRYAEENVRRATTELSRECLMLDLEKLATDSGTFVSATMFGALAGSGVLPWSVDVSRSALGTGKSAKASQAGFDAACKAIASLRQGGEPVIEAPAPNAPAAIGSHTLSHLPEDLRAMLNMGYERCADYQDTAYAQLYVTRALGIIAAGDLRDATAYHAVVEGCRRLALWMAYEDLARVADLKTRRERFERIREEVKLKPGMMLTVTEYMKPRAEELADILPTAIGARIMARVERGGSFPFLGRGINIRSNGPVGYWLLRSVASLRRIRRKSYRFALEQQAFEEWLSALTRSLARAPEFAAALAELPRVLKGYSDTLVRGREAYDQISDVIVRPALARESEAESAPLLRRAISAALADDNHTNLREALAAAAPQATG